MLTEKLIDPEIKKMKDEAGEVECDILPRLIEICQASFHRLWCMERSEIERVLSLLGTSATEVFQKHAAIQTFIETNDPNWIHLTPPYELAFHADGTVTIKE